MNSQHVTIDNNNLPNEMDCAAVNNLKRRRVDDVYAEQSSPQPPVYGKHFLPISKNGNIFYTTEWKASGTSIYCPVIHDMFVNIEKYDQITVTSGDFFVGDIHGNYAKTVSGNAIHMWKHDKSQREYYIAQSFLFTSPQDFAVMQRILYSI